MRVTRRVREEAALLCAIAASTDWGDSEQVIVFGEEARDLYSPDGPVPNHDTAAGKLAWLAERRAWAAWQRSPHWTPETHWAEAEAMLRTGWEP